MIWANGRRPLPGARPTSRQMARLNAQVDYCGDAKAVKAAVVEGDSRSVAAPCPRRQGRRVKGWKGRYCRGLRRVSGRDAARFAGRPGEVDTFSDTDRGSDLDRDDDWQARCAGLPTGRRPAITSRSERGSACTPGGGRGLQNRRAVRPPCGRWVRFPCTSAILPCRETFVLFAFPAAHSSSRRDATGQIRKLQQPMYRRLPIIS